MRDLPGKVAVITGAASGIGRGMAESFAAAGMKVVLSDVEEEALTETTEALRGEGADVHGVVTDVSKAEQVQALADESVKKFGAVHVLCNNAGIGIPSGPEPARNSGQLATSSALIPVLPSRCMRVL